MNFHARRFLRCSEMFRKLTPSPSMCVRMCARLMSTFRLSGANGWIFKKRPRRIRQTVRSIREARSPETHSAHLRSYALTAYLAHTSRIRRCSMHRASRCSESGSQRGAEGRRERTTTSTKEKNGRGGRKVGAPFVAGRCFRLRRPCRLINNTISPVSSCVSQFFSCPRLLPPPPPGRYLPCSRYSTACKPN